MEIYEEIEGNCEICDKKMKVVKRAGVKAEALICQQCGKWDTEGAEEDD